jgi:glyoxylase-like metal-dependent hydrolase (beta-lactamase superfamily II)
MTKYLFMLLIGWLALALCTSAIAQPEPLVREGATVQLGAHTYAIPDGGVGIVPNVGIIVGERATLVIDPGLGRRNGETVLREVARIREGGELYVASTHFHPEHTTGYVAFPESARYVNSTVQEAEFAAEPLGYTATKHQREVGTGYYDVVSNTLNDGKASTLAMDGSTERDQFEAHLAARHGLQDGKRKKP